MKVLFDHQAFTMQKYGGISRYFIELMKHFGKSVKIDSDLALKYSDNVYLEQIRFDAKSLNLPERFKGKSILLSLINKPSSIKKIKENKFNIFHPTYYNPYFLNYLNKHPFVLTVHDMTHELFPEKVSRYDKSSEYKKTLAVKASKIICVSENTRRDLCRILNVNENKTEVIYHGSSIKKPDQKNLPPLPGKYILYVGTRGYYKNFDALYTAVVPLLNEEQDLYLVCAGGGKFNKKEVTQFEASGISKKIIYKKVSDDILPTLYSNALVFVFPSLYEGFGIPILEAFNCDCPVMCSNISSMPEIAGDAAFYIDPKDPEMMRESLRKIMNESDLRENLIFKGTIRRENFSWEKTALLTAALYNNL